MPCIRNLAGCAMSHESSVTDSVSFSFWGYDSLSHFEFVFKLWTQVLNMEI